MTYPAGVTLVAVQPLGVPSFGTGLTAAVPVATPTDVVEIIGASGMVITVLRIIVSGIATAATSMTIQLIRRTTLSTGGAVTAQTPVPRDGKSVATATINLVTTNRVSLGTATAPGGTAESITVPLGTASAPQPPTVIDLTANGMTPPTLRLSTDLFAINMNGATVTGNSLNITIEHQEQQTA
jgi:hypothetical protein